MANFRCWINDANGRRRRKWRGLVKLFDYSADQAEVIALWLGEYANFPPLFFLNHKIWRQIHHGRVDEKTAKVCDVMRILRCCNGSNSPPGCKSTRIEPSIDPPPPLSARAINLIWTHQLSSKSPFERTLHQSTVLEKLRTWLFGWKIIRPSGQLSIRRNHSDVFHEFLERDAWPHRSQKTFDRSRLGL